MKNLLTILLSVVTISSFGQARELLGRDTVTHQPNKIIRDTAKLLKIDTTLRVLSSTPYEMTIGVNPNVMGSGSSGATGSYWPLNTGATAIPGLQTGSYLGTSNNVSLRFKANSQQVAVFDSATGRLSIPSVFLAGNAYQLNVGGDTWTSGVYYGNVFRGTSSAMYIDGNGSLNGTINLRATTINIPVASLTAAGPAAFSGSSFTYTVAGGSAAPTFTGSGTAGLSMRLANSTYSSTWYVENSRRGPNGSLEFNYNLGTIPALILTPTSQAQFGASTMFNTTTTPATPAVGTVVEWWDGTNKKWMKSDGSTGIIY